MILGHVPGMILDDVFLKQSEIAVDVKTQLEASMQPFGYGIFESADHRRDPGRSGEGLHEQHQRRSARPRSCQGGGRGQTDSNGGQAEAEKQAKIRQGEVIAGEREAIAKGLQKSILEIKDALPAFQRVTYSRSSP